MNKHNACIFTLHGWVEIDSENYKAINCVKEQLHDNIFNSNFYKNKEYIFWPKIQKLENYSSNFSSAIYYYDTEFIYNIIRYPEFTPEQFKDALLFLCDVCKYCKDNGYYLRTHLWNVTYVRGYPYLIDIRDFEILKTQDWKIIFLGHFDEKLNNHCPIHISNFMVNHLDISSKLNNCKNDLDDIKNIINEIKIVETNDGKWSNYHETRCNFLYDASIFSNSLYEQIKNFKGGSDDKTKSLNLFTLIEELKPRTIIELGCNNGLYTFGCTKFAPTVGIDYDINAINLANKINKKLKTQATFININLLDENVPEYGMDGAYDNIYTRFRSELVIAPAIIHHLFDQCNSTDKIICIFNKFATKYMIIEQIPNKVNENQLILSLTKYNWKIEKIIPSSPNPRKWFLCIKK